MSSAEDWLALYELLPSKDGLKLRVPIPDTAILDDAGKILGWFYTSKEGILCRASAHEVSSEALLHKLLTQQVIHVGSNPFGYVAVAHYNSGVARLVRRAELQQLAIRIAGPYEPPPPPSSEEDSELPFCIQQYIPPAKDLRYIATYAGTENVTCTTFARKYSSRYTHPFDDPEGAEASTSGPPFGLGGASRPTSAMSNASDAEPRALTSEEMLVESQLIALGLLEPRDMSVGLQPVVGASRSWAPPGPAANEGFQQQQAGPSGRGPVDMIAPASRQMKADVARSVQNIMSFIERAHGLRLQGLVAEFISTSDGTVLFTGVHASQLDQRASRGRLGTFTERWADFLSGMGPTPAPRAPTRKHASPAMLRDNSGRGLLRPTSAVAGGGGHLSRTTITDAPTAILSAGGLRPGSAPPQHLFNRFNGGATPTSASNGHYTLRNAVSAGRRGAGGNPTAQPPHTDSYPLWQPRGDGMPSESVVSALALELEAMKDRLQHQTDIAARSEAALHQLATTSATSHGSLAETLASVRSELEGCMRSRREAEQDAGRLRQEQRGVREQLEASAEEVQRLRHDLERDRETLATAIRGSQVKEENMDGEVARLRDENEELSRRLGHASRRLDEEQEVVEAVRAQLYDYKSMVQTMQLQMRRGKSSRTGQPGLLSTSTSGGGGGNAFNANASMGGPSLRMQQEAMDAAELGMGGEVVGERGGGQAEPPQRPSSGGGGSSGYGQTTPVKNKGPGGAGGGGTAGNGAAGRRPQSGLPGSRSVQCSPSPTPDSPPPAGGSSPGGGTTPPPGLPDRGRVRAIAQVMASITPQTAVGEQQRPGTVSFAVAENVGTDHPANELADIRRQRRIQALQTDTSLAQSAATFGGIALLIGGAASAAGIIGVAVGAGAAAVSAAASAEDQKRINYESLRINDLVLPENGLPITGKQLEVIAKIGRMLQDHEEELRDIFSFYGTISRVVVVDSRVCMTESQFFKFARETGLHEDLVYAEVLEEIFRPLADKLQGYRYGLGSSDTDHILFEVFPEVICRLAAAKFDWHPPEMLDDMKSEAQSTAEEELPYRSSSRAEFSSSTSFKNNARPSSGAGSPSPNNNRTSLGGNARPSGNGEWEPDVGRRSPSPPPLIGMREQAPAEIVVYTLVKAYLYLNVLPQARRYKNGGTRAAKDRAKPRTAPLDTWVT